MSLHERTGTRDLLYSRWHRQDMIRRYLGPVDAAKLKAVDGDMIEACQFCSEPLALFEWQASKSTPKVAGAYIMGRVGARADLSTYSGSYEPNADHTDIVAFRIRQIAPRLEPELPKMDAYTFAHRLLDIHISTPHECSVAA